MERTTQYKSDSGLFVAFLVLLFWLPLPFGSNRPWAWSIMEVWVFALALVWCWLLYKDKVSLSHSLLAARYVLLLFGLWLVYVFISNWTSLEPHATRAGLLKSVAYVLIFFVCLVLVDSRKRLKHLGNTLVFSGLFQAVYGSLMALSGIGYTFFIKNDNAMNGMATGSYISKNNFAGYLEMVIPVGIGMLIALMGQSDNEGKTWKRKLINFFNLLLSPKARLRLFLVIMVIALVLSRSRMGNTAFFSSLLIAGSIGILLSHHAKRSIVILFISLIVIDIFIIGAWFGLEKVAQRLEQTSLVREQRDEVYKYTWQLWTEHKVTGTGLGSFYAVFPTYRQHDIRGLYSLTENDYLQFLGETGVIGTSILGVIVIASLTAALMAQYRRRDPLMRGISFAVIMGVTAILIHSSVDFNLQIPANAATFVILLALGWISLTLREKNVKSEVLGVRGNSFRQDLQDVSGKR